MKKVSRNFRIGMLIIILLLLVVVCCAFGVKVAEYTKPPKLFYNTQLEYGEEVDFSKVFEDLDGEFIKVEGYDCKKLGKQEVSVVVKRNNIEHELICSFTVKDSNPPIIEFKEDAIKLDYGKDLDLKANVVICKDIVDGDLEYTLSGEVNKNKVGKYSIEVKAVDNNGLSTSKSFVVEVLPKPVPTATPVPTKKPSTVSNSVSNSVQETVAPVTDTVTEEVEEQSQVVSNSYSHGINMSAVPYYRFSTSKRDEVLKCFRENTNQFWNMETGDVMDVISKYLNIADTIYFTIYPTDTGKYLVMDEDKFTFYKEKVAEQDAGFARYRSSVSSYLGSLNLNTTDRNLVNQINNFIVNNFSYVQTEDYLYTFTDNKIGQCVHYANLFKDMCNAVGIPCSLVEGSLRGIGHTWNVVTVEGVQYYFDVSGNDTGGNGNYSWMSSSQMSGYSW